MKNTMVIVLVGKGGVGKTSISALTVRLLARKYPDKKILAIDADPAVGLATALGVEVCSTVDDIRKAFVHSAEEGNTAAAIEMLGEAKYRLMDALTEQKNLSFLAIGRPEAAGCYNDEPKGRSRRRNASPAAGCPYLSLFYRIHDNPNPFPMGNGFGFLMCKSPPMAVFRLEYGNQPGV